MKNLKIKNLAVASAFVAGNMFLITGYATTCTPNQDPTADCSALFVSTPGLSITNSYVLDMDGFDSGLFVNNASGLVNITNTSTGVIENFFVMGHLGLLDNAVGGQIYTDALSAINYNLTNGGSPTNTAIIDEIRNYGTITSSTAVSIYNHQAATITAINNYSVIQGHTNAISNDGLISSINNIGSSSQIISSSTFTESGIYNGVTGTITSITNQGVISAGPNGYGIYNDGVITTLNNGQGGGNNAGALIYGGVLPINYNIIINSLSSYGKLEVTSGTPSQTNFGIYAGSAVTRGTYTAVLSGVSLSNLNSTSGSYNGFRWSLINSSLDIWDLVITGVSSQDTQASMSVMANRLRGIYNLQSSALINGLSYDCQVFDKNNICLSTGGRYSVNSGAYGNTTSALLIGAYRLNKNVRIGAWLDQNLSTNTGTGVNLGNSKPLFGVFGAWAENPTGEGYEVKASAGYGDKDLTVTRDVIGTSEAGVGNSRLNSQAISSVSSYGFRLNNQLLASPYVGIRYSKITSNGYTEASSDAVTAPLTYNRLSQENVALMAGLKLSAKLDPKITLVASAGIEQNLKNRAGQYSATGVDGLTPIEFNSNPQKTRATASVGAYYDIDKKQRVAVNGIYREETFNPTATTSVLATYTVGF